MLRDLRHGIRVLLQAKGWTAVVVVSLALGIGANTALFSAVNGLLLRKIAVSDPDTLVRFRAAGRNQMATSTSDYGATGKIDGQDVRTTFSYSIYQQFRAANQTLSDLFACAPTGNVNVIVDGTAALASSFFSSGNYYQVLGISAQRGRTIQPDDDRPDAPAVAVIGDKYWRTRFATDPKIVGRSIIVNGLPVTIVGVLPAEYRGVQRPMGDGRDIGMPLSLDGPISGARQPRLAEPTYFWLQVMGRRKPGVSVEQVQANFETVFANTARANMDAHLASLPEAARNQEGNRNRTSVPRLYVDSGNHGMYDARPADVSAVTFLSVVVVLVLLIVCANVANLLLSRAASRSKEISIRLSLGATRGRLIRQLLTESLLLAACGGALGILLSGWGRTLLPGTLNQPVPMDWRFLAFIFGITTATAVIFGIAPAVRSTRDNVSDALKESSRGVVAGRSLLSKSLLVAQVALSVLLLVGAGLFLRTLDNLRRVDVGFNTNNLLLFGVDPQLNRYDAARQRTLYQDMIERLQGLGGVQAAALSEPAMLSGSVSGTTIYVRGVTYQQDESHSINRVKVSPTFVDTMEIRLLAGRGLTAADRADAPMVALINETAARKYFPGGSPVGQRFGTGREDDAKFEVVGVVSDVKYDSVREVPPPTMYEPYQQNTPGGASFLLRTAGDPLALVSAVREVVRQIDPNLPVIAVTTQEQNVEGRLLQERVFARAYALFGGLAMVIAAIGLFGVMSHSVARRTNEIGIRMALGAQAGDMLRLVMGESMTLVAVGVVLGSAAALAAGRFVASMLFGVETTDVPTLIAAVGMMFAISLVAGFLPARRASKVDPMVALRYE